MGNDICFNLYGKQREDLELPPCHDFFVVNFGCTLRSLDEKDELLEALRRGPASQGGRVEAIGMRTKGSQSGVTLQGMGTALQQFMTTQERPFCIMIGTNCPGGGGFVPDEWTRWPMYHPYMWKAAREHIGLPGKPRDPTEPPLTGYITPNEVFEVIADAVGSEQRVSVLILGDGNPYLERSVDILPRGTPLATISTNWVISHREQINLWMKESLSDMAPGPTALDLFYSYFVTSTLDNRDDPYFATARQYEMRPRKDLLKLIRKNQTISPTTTALFVRAFGQSARFEAIARDIENAQAVEGLKDDDFGIALMLAFREVNGHSWKDPNPHWSRKGPTDIASLGTDSTEVTTVTPWDTGSVDAGDQTPGKWRAESAAGRIAPGNRGPVRGTGRGPRPGSFRYGGLRAPTPPSRPRIPGGLGRVGGAAVGVL
ncbi:MAG: hypothetical protein M1833_002645 [Piccolia ochrophora]|nr:MAG: hypothetical protein M1833_002645 [Piccolia ochrophora]